MSKFAQRDAMEFECELRPWTIIAETNHIMGIVSWSKSKEYVLGERYTIMNVKLTLYPRSDRWGAEHFVAESQTGKLFLLKGHSS